jgi:hypothetical protein
MALRMLRHFLCDCLQPPTFLHPLFHCSCDEQTCACTASAAPGKMAGGVAFLPGTYGRSRHTRAAIASIRSSCSPQMQGRQFTEVVISMIQNGQTGKRIKQTWQNAARTAAAASLAPKSSNAVAHLLPTTPACDTRAGAAGVPSKDLRPRRRSEV